LLVSVVYPAFSSYHSTQTNRYPGDDPRAWYWSGTTSKGKVGIFPKSHIRIETVKDGSQEEPPALKKKSTQKSGLGGLFSRS
jgi:hypothetical protein